MPNGPRSGRNAEEEEVGADIMDVPLGKGGADEVRFWDEVLLEVGLLPRPARLELLDAVAAG
jgi:hypothetical protein